MCCSTISRGNENKKKSVRPIVKKICTSAVIILLPLLLSRIACAAETAGISQPVEIKKATKVASTLKKPFTALVSGYKMCKKPLTDYINQRTSKKIQGYPVVSPFQFGSPRKFSRSTFIIVFWIFFAAGYYNDYKVWQDLNLYDDYGY